MLGCAGVCGRDQESCELTDLHLVRAQAADRPQPPVAVQEAAVQEPGAVR